MPRGRPRQSQATQDDDADLSQTQARSGVSLSAEDADRLAARVVRFVLKTHALGKPLRRNDIRKQAVPEQYTRCLNHILDTANSKLEHVFGMSLEELSSKANLVLVNRLSVSAETPHVTLPEHELQKRGLLMAILTLILMNNDTVKEELLWAFLKRLGVEGGVKHECFGDVNKLITQEFVRAGYLTESKGEQGGQKEYGWGEAAYKQVDQKELLQFFCNIWGEGTEPKNWTEQYNRVVARTQELEADEE